MPDDQKPLLTELLAQAQPPREEVIATLGEYITSGMFISSDAVTPDLDKIDFSVQQLESLAVMLGAAIDTHKKKPKLVHEYGRVKDYFRARIERANNPNSNGKPNGYKG